ARLFDFAELVSLAASSAEARQSLVESRQRIVEAGDDERQRLGRKLHDGAQQRLISVILTLRLLKTKIPGVELEGIVDTAIEEARLAHDELRELARGLHPVALSEQGVGPALAALLEHSALPVELDVAPERFPEQLEAAAYYIVVEAVANAGKHAHASRIHVRVRVTGENGREREDRGRGGRHRRRPLRRLGPARPRRPSRGTGRRADGDEQAWQRHASPRRVRTRG